MDISEKNKNKSLSTKKVKSPALKKEEDIPSKDLNEIEIEIDSSYLKRNKEAKENTPKVVDYLAKNYLLVGNLIKKQEPEGANIHAGNIELEEDSRIE